MESTTLKCFAAAAIGTSRRPRIGIAVFIAVFLSACSTPRSDLARLYAAQQNGVGQPPVVLVHGLFGARLVDRDTGAELWPGSTGADRRFEALALEIDPATLMPAADRIKASGIADRAANIALDDNIIPVLEDIGGFVEGQLGTPVVDERRRYYVFHYDWRKGNVHTVRKLDAFLEQVRRDHGDPDLRVDFVAHGMGGLIARYYMRYGTLDTLDDNDFPVNYAGADRIRRVILLGVPNLGAVRVTHFMLEGLDVGAAHVPAEVFATLPSLYQAFPHPIAGWLLGIDGQPLPGDLFDAPLWRDLRWGVFDPIVQARIASRFDDPAEAQARIALLQSYLGKHIERGRRFIWSLTVPAPELNEAYIVMGGACDWTPARLLLEEVNGQRHVRLDPDQVRAKLPGLDYRALMMEPGDGAVTKASQLARQTIDPSVARHRYSYFPLDYSVFLCARHDELTSNLDFQNNLLHALLSVDDQR